jgi:hypothetical protein
MVGVWVAVAAVVAVIGFVLVDTLAGRHWHRRGTQARLHVTPARSGQPEQVIVAFPGYTMAGSLLSAAFAPHLGEHDAMVVVEYAERGVDIEQIYRAVMAEVAAIGAPALRVYGGSMGGMCAKHFLDRYHRDGARYGKVVFLVDTAPSRPADVKRPRWLMALGRWYLGGPVGSAIWSAVSWLEPRPVAEPYADPQIISAFRRATARVGLPAIASQAAYIAGFVGLGGNELVPVAERVAFLHGYGHAGDPVIRVGRAITGWRHAFPDLRVISIDARQGRWHLPLIERPRETVRAILAG